MTHKLVYIFQSLLLHRTKEKAAEVFLFNIITIHYYCHEALLKPHKSEYVWEI